MPAQGALEFSRYIIRGGGAGGGPEHAFTVLGGEFQIIQGSTESNPYGVRIKNYLKLKCTKH